MQKLALLFLMPHGTCLPLIMRSLLIFDSLLITILRAILLLKTRFFGILSTLRRLKWQLYGTPFENGGLLLTGTKQHDIKVYRLGFLFCSGWDFIKDFGRKIDLLITELFWKFCIFYVRFPLKALTVSSFIARSRSKS